MKDDKTEKGLAMLNTQLSSYTLHCSLSRYMYEDVHSKSAYGDLPSVRWLRLSAPNGGAQVLTSQELDLTGHN